MSTSTHPFSATDGNRRNLPHMAGKSSPRADDLLDCGCCRPPACSAQALAQLGPLLCLYPAGDLNPLIGWGRARQTLHCAGIDVEGPREAMLFLDAMGCVCWQLCLLPDTDFLRWDQLVGALPQRELRLSRGHRCATTTGSVARAVGEPLWRACPMRLHAVSSHGDAGRLAAANAALSPAGQREARRLAQRALPGEPPPLATLASTPSELPQAGVSSR